MIKIFKLEKDITEIKNAIVSLDTKKTRDN